MDTVLIVEDDQSMRYILRQTLEDHNFLVIEAAHGKRLFEVITAHVVDLILLDLNLPDGTGIEFLKKIRDQTNAPILFLTGDKNKENTLKGLNGGADDYIEKICDQDILMARVKANLRRYKGYVSKHIKIDNFPSIIKFDNWVLDRSQFQIFDQNGVSAHLTACEFYLLDTLLKNAGRAVKRQELCEAINQDNYTPTPRAIDVKITRIRKKIGDSASQPHIIRTVRGIGYMLKKDVLDHI